MFWQAFLAILAALTVYKFAGAAWRRHSLTRQLKNSSTVWAVHKLGEGMLIQGFEIDDYETDDVFLWDRGRNCEWRFSRYDGIKLPRTWRPTDRDVFSFLRTVRQIELRRQQPVEDHGQFLIASA